MCEVTVSHKEVVLSALALTKIVGLLRVPTGSPMNGSVELKCLVCGTCYGYYSPVTDYLMSQVLADAQTWTTDNSCIRYKCNLCLTRSILRDDQVDRDRLLRISTPIQSKAKRPPFYVPDRYAKFLR